MNATTANPQSIFFAAIEKHLPDQWPAFLDGACGDDVALRARVEQLLAAHLALGSIHPRVSALSEATIDQPLSELPGTLIGPYKLLEQIGEGGMGLVYMAEQQQPVRRLVALKIIKPGFDSKQTIARFEAERQALAMMDHPNIAKVLDAGTISSRQTPSAALLDHGTQSVPTTEGRPYFVMELVRGLPINEFCDQKRLTVRERLQLFVQVCQAVQHAHQKGIIHRDLKPTNVLVTMADTVAFPKLLDFGIAKALGQSLTDNTLHTGYAQFVGTPLYMSPEQAEMNLFGVDTRSDVYSLGVLLYELLTGTTPFDKDRLTKVGFDEMRRIIREEEPETVSQQLRAKTKGSPLAPREEPIGHGTRSVPATELDWIVMKSLEKDRSRRYESASALAADIQRYLSDDPVLACPPTTMYRFQKFARKHKRALSTAAAIALCLLLGTTVSAWQAVRATTAEAQANANATQAQEKAQEATAQRDEAQRQRDEVKALNDKLAAKELQLQRNLYASNMNLAKSAWDAGKIQRVNELLDQHRPQPGEADLRSFEWHYLHRLCHSEILTLEPLVRVAGMAYSPDGTRLATALYDKTLKVWDTQTGKILLTVKLDEFSECIAYSPDGKRLAFGRSVWDDAKKRYIANEVKVCDSQTGQELITCKGHTLLVSSVTFSPDGKRLASGSEEAWSIEGEPAELKVWDAQTGQELLNCPGHAGERVDSLAFSPDGKLLASADWSGVSKVWDAQTGQDLLTLQGTTVGFSPDGMRLASGVKVWDAQTGKELVALKGSERNLTASPKLTFSPDGKRLASTGRYVTVWDAETGDELLTFKGHTNRAGSVVFSPDGKRLAAHGGDHTIKIWDATTSQEARTLIGDTSRFGSVAFSPDGSRLAGATETEVKVLDVQSGQELSSLTGHSSRTNSVAYSRDGKLLASASSDKTVKLWDAPSGRELLTFKGHTAAVIWVAFSPDSTRVVSCSSLPGEIRFGGGIPAKDPGEPGEVVVWDASSGEELLNLKGHTKFVNAVAYSPNGKRLATLSRDQTVKVWDAQTGQELLTLKVFVALGGSLAFSPDGKRLAASNAAPPSTAPRSPSGVKVWDTQTGEELLSLPAGRVWSLEFTPDGKRLVTGTGGGGGGQELQVWDAQTGQELLTLDGGTGRTNGMALSPDGHRLVGRGHDRTVKIWDATPLPEKP